VISDSRKSKRPTVWCRICGRGYASEASAYSHVYDKHPGTPRSSWYSGTPVTTPALGRLPLTKPEPAPPKASAKPEVPADLVSAQMDGSKQRIYPPRDDRHNAEILAGLPWMTWPASVEQCDDALNGIAIGLERTTIANAFWLSLRSYVTALRKRLAQKAAA
jgi:hypothetical protein